MIASPDASHRQTAASRFAALRHSGLLEAAGKKQFDLHTDLVRVVLDVPVAVVSLIEEDRQVFAAHHGLPSEWAARGETPLTHSFCQHVVNDACPLIVDDARSNPVLQSNLAIDDLGVVAYLGVPIFLPTGEIVGALAAIDGEPRHWTDRDLSQLRAIAAVVTDKIRDFVSAQRWRSIFENLSEGVIVGEVIRDAAGKVTDWRYSEVNEAWGNLVGIPLEQAIGKTIRELIPGIEDEWVYELASVTDTGEPIRFTREVGSFGRWYDGYAQEIGHDTFVVIFIEVTDRILTDRRELEQHRSQNRRMSALVELGDALRQLSRPSEMAAAAARVVGKALGAARAGYGIVDDKTETVVISEDWTAENIASVAGTHHFRDYGSYIDDLKEGRSVFIADVNADERTRTSVPAFSALDIVGLTNLPMMDNGHFVGLLYVHFDVARDLAPEERDFISNVADRTQAAIAKANAEEQQVLLNGEITHRLKNTLAMVQAIAQQTLRDIPERAAVESLQKRIYALSNAHDLLFERAWTNAPMRSVIVSVLKNFADLGRFSIDGPDVDLGPRTTLSLSLLTHELATNALKYGALSVPEGHIAIHWQILEEAGGVQLVLTWSERGGPPAIAPTRKGFGSRLISLGLVGPGGTNVVYAEQGFDGVFSAPLSQAQAS